MTARMSFVAELNLVVDAAGATTRLLFGTEGWVTKPTDTPANTHIAGVLADPGSIRSELFSGARLTGPVRPSFGQIVLNNADGALDGMMSYGMGGTVTVRYGSVGDAYPSAWTTVFIAYAYALVVDFREVRVLLRDRLFLLDKPIVTETFAGFGGLSGTGIANKKQQMVLGRPGLIPLVLIDQNAQIYWMQGNGASARQWLFSDSADYHVFDGGVPLARGAPYTTAEEGVTVEPAPGEFRLFGMGAATDARYESTGPVYVRLGSPPEFELRAQAVGLLKNDANSRAAPWTFVDLLNRAGITDVTTGNLAPGSTVLRAGNRLIDGDQTYLEVMSDVAAARFDAFGFDRLDRFFMFNLQLGDEGADAAVHTFTVHNAKDFRRQPVPGQEAPAWQVSVNAGMAWPSQIANSLSAEQADKFQRERQQSFTGTADSVRTANPGAESATMEVVGNEFSTLDQRKAFVKRYFELFGARRDLIAVTAPLSPETIAIDLHSKVMISMPRLGCGGGRTFRVVMSDLNLRARTATFWLWGGTIGPSDAVLGGGSTDTGGGSIPPGKFEPLVEMGEFLAQLSGSVGGGGGGTLEAEMGEFTFVTNVNSAFTDPDWPKVTFLLNTNGADNSTTFTDASTLAHTITTLGGAKITGNQLDADGTGDYLRAPKHAGFDLGSGDFCIEVIAAVRNNPATGPRPLLAYWRTGAAELSWFFGIDNSNSLVFYYSIDGGSGVFTPVSAGPITPLNTQRHLMVNRIGGTLRLFIDGSKQYEATHSLTFHSPATTPLTVAGVDYSSSSSHTDLLLSHRTARITKGSGRGYTATFTPPTGPFPNS